MSDTITTTVSVTAPVAVTLYPGSTVQVGNTAKTHASAHAGAATYNVDRTITGGAGGAFTAPAINLPAGIYTLNFAYAPAGAAESFTHIDLVAAGATWGFPNVSGFATPTAISNGYRLTIESMPAQLEVSLSHTSAIGLVVSGVISESGKTAEFDISAVVTAGSDPVTVKSSQIVDAGYGSCVALLDSNGTLPLANGGTGATTAGAALTNLGGGTTGKALFAAETEASAQSAIGMATGIVKSKARPWSISSGATPGCAVVDSGNTAGASVIYNYSNVSYPLSPLCRAGDDRTKINFSRTHTIGMEIILANVSGTGVAYIFVGETFNASSTIQPNKKGFGVFFSTSGIKLWVHNGTTLTLGAATAWSPSDAIRELVMVFDGSTGILSGTLDGTALGNAEGGPSGLSAPNNNAVSFQAKTGSTNERCRIFALFPWSYSV